MGLDFGIGGVRNGFSTHPALSNVGVGLIASSRYQLILVETGSLNREGKSYEVKTQTK